MKKSDTEQDTSVLEEKIVPERQTDEELDKELQQIEEENRREEQYYEERRRERHERNLKRKKRQIRNRNLALIITALVILGGVGYYFRDQLGLQDKAEMLVAKAKDVIPGNSTQSQENTGSADGEPETEGKTTGETPEADANSVDDSENQENDGSDTGKAGQEGNSTGESSDTQNQSEQEVTQAAAEDVNRVMPQAAAAGAGIIRRQIRHEKKVLTTAKEKAAQYDYDGAISLLQKDNAYVRNVHFQNAVQKFQKTKDKCVAWSPEQVTHIFYHSLIVDTSKAFDGDYKTDGYNQVMTTITEFNKITQIMYDKGYVMVNLYDLAGLDEDDRMKAKQIYLPKGKTPFVLSQDDVCYYHSQDGDGIATRLVVDDEGKVRNEYVQDDGYRTDISYQTRPDDLNDDKKAWLDAHPDFDLDTERAGAKKVADAMKAEGWTFASHTWGHKNMSTVSMERLQTDTENFKENVDPLIGGTDIIIFAFGADINGGGEYTGDEKFNYLKSQGYDYYCNVDSNKYFVQITDEYFRMGRRNVDGYSMYYNPELLSDLFDASEVFDSSRPTPVPPMNGG